MYACSRVLSKYLFSIYGGTHSCPRHWSEKRTFSASGTSWTQREPLRRAVRIVRQRLLRGKLKPDFTPNVDCGDYVIIVNVEKAVLTGRKLEEKYYRRHSGWIGGLKETKYKTLMAERPEFAMELAVKGMLPKNTIGRTAMTRLKLFKGPEHIHAAQKPEAWTQD